MRGFLSALCAVLLLATGCSSNGEVALASSDGEDETIVDAADSTADVEALASAADTDTDTDGPSDVDQARLCDALTADDIDPGIVDLVPERYRASMAGLTALPEDLDADGTAQLIELLTENPSMGSDLRAIIDGLDDCDSAELSEAMAVADMLILWNGEPTDAYCDFVAEWYAAVDEAPAFDATVIITEHVDAWNRLTAYGDDASSLDDLDQDALWRLFSDTAGLGLYAEGRCGQEGAFAGSFMGAALLVSVASGDFGDGGSIDFAPAEEETVTWPADPEANGEFVIERTPLDDATAQNLMALVPTESGITGFDRVVLDVDADDNLGRYVIDAIVPTGWVSSEFFGVSFDPVPDSGIGFFTDLSFDASCQGLCGVADDWPDRFESFFEEGVALETGEALSGPVGRLVVTPGSVTTDVRVGRWSDTTDRMLTCRAALDTDDDLDLVDLFSELCRLATARWL